MRRATRDRARATRLRMIHAAQKVFTGHGYAGARMIDIAAEAGVAVQTVYFTFHTKAQLLQACYELAVLGEDDPRPPPAQPWYTAMLKAIDGRAALRCFAEGNSAIAARVAVLDDVARAAGSGKSTLARQLAGQTRLPLVERDGLGAEGSASYLSALAEMAARPRWVLDGAPYYADELVYSAAIPSSSSTTPRPWCCGGRCGGRHASRCSAAGQARTGRRDCRRWGSGSIRWAWSSHADRHREGLALMARPDLAQTQILRFTRPAMARRWLRLRASA